MILSHKNIKTWKAKMDKMSAKEIGWKLSDTLSDEDWLADYIGEDYHDVVYDNVRLSYE